MSDTSTENKTLARQRFLSLVGASALGFWLIQQIPSGLSLLKPPARKAVKPVSHQAAARIRIHPEAVKRET